MVSALSRVRVVGIGCLLALVALGCGKSDSPSPSNPAVVVEAPKPASQPAVPVDQPLAALPGTVLYQYAVEGMHCQGCADTITKHVQTLPGVKQVRVSFARKTAWVMVEDGSPTSSAQIEQTVMTTGYRAKPLSSSAPASQPSGVPQPGRTR
jgi:copper chaperone CopZ